MNPGDFTVGSLDCMAAVFVYKNDGTGERIWKDVKDQYETEKAKGLPTNVFDPFHGQWHRSKESFLNGLRAWHTHGDSRNTFLCINSHAGPRGINCVGITAPAPERDANRIIWQELASCLSQSVDYLWLLGCETEEATNVWNAQEVPVQRMLLVTTTTGYYPDLIKCFLRFEIGMDITYVPEMPDVIRQCAPELGSKTKYLLRSGTGWAELPPSE